MKDFFEHPEEIPKEVSEILDAIDFDDASYFDLNKGIADLNQIGWTFDYGLDAVPFDLKPLVSNG